MSQGKASGTLGGQKTSWVRATRALELSEDDRPAIQPLLQLPVLPVIYHSHSADCNCPDSHDRWLTPQAKQRQLITALLLVGGFAVVELTVGLVSHSLALVAESGHLASDSAALLLALAATWLAHSRDRALLSDPLPLAPRQHPLELWAALINGAGLLVLSGWIGWEAVQRLQVVPEDIASLPMLITAIVGLGVNGFIIRVLHPGSLQDLNLKAALLHVLADALSSIGVILAAVAVASQHWLWADGAISLLISGSIGVSAIVLIYESFKRLVLRP